MSRFLDAPQAVMGYRADPGNGFMVRVCGYCPDAPAALAWADPLPVSHGICPECYQRQLEALLGERPHPFKQEKCLTVPPRPTITHRHA